LDTQALLWLPLAEGGYRASVPVKF
jgi:hypothetical protein